MNWLNPKLALACVLILLLGSTQIALGAAANNDCEDAQAVSESNSITFDTREADFDGPGGCNYGPNVWFCYTASCTGEVTITLSDAHYDTVLAVYNGCDCDITRDDRVACNDDYDETTWLSQVIFDAVAGNKYLIEIGGYQDYTGDGTMSIRCVGESGGPAKDNCENAQEIGDVSSLSFDTTDATFDGPGLCMTSPNVWYLYTASCTGEATVSLAGSSFDTMLAVYDDDDCDLSSSDLIACNDDYPPGHQSQITFDTIDGREYLIEVGGYGTSTGEGVISISCNPENQPGGDDCDEATAVSEVTDFSFDTTEATFDGSGYCMTSPNIWFVYTPTCTGEATISLLGSSFDTMLAVYEGDDCYPTSNDLIECNDDYSPGYTSQITLSVTAGHKYLIEIGGYGSNTGEGILNIDCEPSGQPSKDDCDNAQTVGEIKNLEFDTSDATFDGPGLCLTSPNIWFLYTASCTGDVTVSLAGSSFDTMLAVYEGDDCDLASKDLIECNDDAPGGGYQSEITFAAYAGDEYLIEIGGYGSNKGEGILNITCESGAVSDKMDLGDAPDSTNHNNRNMNAYSGVKANFPTVYGGSTGPYGPVHLNDIVVAYLGKSITRETEADTGTDEDGVNNITPLSGLSDDDGGDDGIELPLNLPDCQWTTFEYAVTVVDPDVDLWVNIWFDWNRDGDWDDTLECTQGDAPEWAVQNQFLFDLDEGVNEIRTPAILAWHPEEGTQKIWMRITLSEEPWKGGSNSDDKGNGGSGPEDMYLYGETEDYLFTPDTSYTICQDFNGDGEINTDDLVDFTAEWLENCPD